MITRTARRRRRQTRRGAAWMRQTHNLAKARHLTKKAYAIETAWLRGKPVRENGRFVSAKALYNRISRMLRSRPQETVEFTPASA